MQIARALSRLLNAVLGGEGDTTFSAYSWHLAKRGDPMGRLRVQLVDAIMGAGHCRESWVWHDERRLFGPE